MRNCSADGCATSPAATPRPGGTSSKASASSPPKAAVLPTKCRPSMRCSGCAEQFFTRATPGGAAARRAPRTDVPQPIFIIGFPRSGTTLIEQILCSHSQVQAGGELTFIGELQKLAERAAAWCGGLPGKSRTQLDRRSSLRRAAVPRLLLCACRAVRTVQHRQASVHRQDALQRNPSAVAENGVSARRKSSARCVIRWTCAYR